MSPFDISKDNGDEVKGLLQRLVDREWEEDEKFQFKIKGRVKIVLQAKPTNNQPGNGFVVFRNERGDSVSPRWRVLRSTINAPGFAEYFARFMRRPMEETLGNNDITKDKRFQAAFLILFEIARRVEKNTNSPSRDETEEALRISQKTKNFDNLWHMFTQPPTGNDFTIRRMAYDRAKRQDEDVIGNLLNVMQSLLIGWW